MSATPPDPGQALEQGLAIDPFAGAVAGGLPDELDPDPAYPDIARELSSPADAASVGFPPVAETGATLGNDRRSGSPNYRFESVRNRSGTHWESQVARMSREPLLLEPALAPDETPRVETVHEVDDEDVLEVRSACAHSLTGPPPPPNARPLERPTSSSRSLPPTLDETPTVESPIQSWRAAGDAQPIAPAAFSDSDEDVQPHEAAPSPDVEPREAGLGQPLDATPVSVAGEATAPTEGNVAAPTSVAEDPLPSGTTPALPYIGSVTDGWTRSLLEVLEAELGVERSPARRALLLHETGVVARDLLGDADLAATSFRAAHHQDPTIVANEWALAVALASNSQALEGLLGQDAASPWAHHRRGCLMLAATSDLTRALPHWVGAPRQGEGAIGPLLASYPHQRPPSATLLAGDISEADLAPALATLGSAVAMSEGPVLSGVLLLDLVALNLSARPDGSTSSVTQRVDPLFVEAHANLGAVPALLALLEPYVVRTGSYELWYTALRDRFESVAAQLDRGQLVRGDARDELGEILSKSAWALEKLGRPNEALHEYHHALHWLPDDAFVMLRAGELARQIGRADEHRAHLSRIAQHTRDPAEAANAMFQMGVIAQTALADEALAAHDFERAIELLPTFRPALAALGRQAISQGRWDDVRGRFEAEIERLESALEAHPPTDIRRGLVRSLLTRYYRVARLVEQELSDPLAALEYDQRALVLAPDFLPPLMAIEHRLEEDGRWSDLVELYLRLGERTDPDGPEAVPFLLRAAEVLRFYLHNDEDAARVYARVLARTPDHPYALNRAAETFERIGNREAQVEIECALARLADAEEVVGGHWLRAAELQELDGEPTNAARDALPLYVKALKARPHDVAALDGLMRASIQLGQPDWLETHFNDWIATEAVDTPPEPQAEGSEVDEPADIAFEPTPVEDARSAPELPFLIWLQAAEALLSHGRFPVAKRLIDSALVRMPIGTELGEQRPSLLALQSHICDLAGSKAYVERARASLVACLEHAGARPEVQATWLVRLADTRAAGLGDTEGAAAAYRCALERVPGHPAALDGLQRGKPEAVQPDVCQTVSGAGADASPEAVQPDVCQTVAGAGADASPEAERAALLARFGREPERGDLFEALMASFSMPGDRAERLSAMRLRISHEQGPDRLQTLASLLGQCEEERNDAGIVEAARELLALDPTSLPALLAMQHQARRRGEFELVVSLSERLANVVQSPRRSAQALYEAACISRDTAATVERVRSLLERAVARDPTHAEATEALEALLRDSEEWPALLELLDRRLDAGPDSCLRKALLRSRAEVLADGLKRPSAAMASLERLLAQWPDDGPALLDAAALAHAAGALERAGVLLERAGAHPAAEIRAGAAVQRGRLALLGGHVDACMTHLESALGEQPDLTSAWELLSEARAGKRDWKGTLEALHRLYVIEKEPAKRAGRATAIAEILARVFDDHRAASGWFKRAVELQPSQRATLWRLLEEVDRVASGSRPDALPANAVRPAIKGALDALRRELAEHPYDRVRLHELVRLLDHLGEQDAWFVAAAALVHVSRDPLPDETSPISNDLGQIQAAFEHQRARVNVDIVTSIDADDHRTKLAHPHESKPWGTLFGTLGPAVAAMLAEPLPEDAIRLSTRSFAHWQGDFRPLARGLGLEGVALYRVPGAGMRAAYFPEPAVVVGNDLLGRFLDAEQAFHVGRLVEGLRDGRGVLVDCGPTAVAACIDRLAERVCPGRFGPPDLWMPLPAAVLERIEVHARELPASMVAKVSEGLAENALKRPQLVELSAAIRVTCDRAGLLTCGDLSVALDAVAGHGDHESSPRSAVPCQRAVDLMRFALSNRYLSLRRKLGVAV